MIDQSKQMPLGAGRNPPLVFAGRRPQGSFKGNEVEQVVPKSASMVSPAGLKNYLLYL